MAKATQNILNVIKFIIIITSQKAIPKIWGIQKNTELILAMIRFGLHD